MLGVVVILVGRLIELQIFKHREYLRMARENAARISPIYPPRGWMTDRYGEILVTNESRFSLIVLPYLITDENRDLTAGRLEKFTHIPKKEFLQKLGNASGRFRAVTLRRIISKELATRLVELEAQLPGVVVEQRPTRRYRKGNLLAHVEGYVGEVTTEELSKLARAGYAQKDFIGKDGIEKQFDAYLRGRRGGQQIEVDVRGRPIRLTEMVEPVPGMSLKLTVDSGLQEEVEDALGEEWGSVIVMDAKTGAVRALASRPTFDPTDVDAGLDARGHPFLNRALSAYPPGSTFKVATLMAALEKGVATLDETIECPGWYRVGSRVAKCWKLDGHGKLNVIEGLVWSCDVVFYELGRRLEIAPIAEYATRLGFGSATRIDLPNEKDGFIPTENWKQETLSEPWYPGDFINHAIGQGFIQVTPIQMAKVFAQLATGMTVAPYVVEEIEDLNREVAYRHTDVEEKSEPLKVDTENLDLVRKALRQAVLRGTGVAARVAGLPAAGKTGTAENPGPAHAWFAAFAPWEDPEIVIVVFVEHGEHGDRAAARAAGRVLKWYKENRATNLVFEEAEFPPQKMIQGPYAPENFATKVDRVETRLATSESP